MDNAGGNTMKTTLCGIALQSPFILGSGPLSYSGEGMIRAYAAGAGAVVTKTIRDEAAINPVPHMDLSTPGSMINSEKWSDYQPERWIEQEIPKAKAAGVVVIASIGHTAEEVEHWVAAADRAGADMIELVSYEQQTLIPMIEMARRCTGKPIIAKLSPNWPDPVSCAKAAEQAGADALTAMDSLGPVLKIDIETARPALGGPGGTGWLSGAAIKPLVIRYVAEIARVVSIPIIGLGGVIQADDAVEMMMAGAQAVGICTAALLKGVDYIGVLDRKTDRRMKDLGYERYEDLCGAVRAALGEIEETAVLSFSFEPDLCTNCRRCVNLCPYGSRSLRDAIMQVDSSTCRQCGLCVAACPTGALKGSTRGC